MRRVVLGLLIVVLGGAGALAQDDAAPALEVVEMGFGNGYDREARALIGEQAEFPAETGTVYCRTRIVGAAEPTSVTHVWYRDGKTVAHVELTVGSPDWRTVSSKQLLPSWTGDWEVRVLDEAGNLLRAEAFVVR